MANKLGAVIISTILLTTIIIGCNNSFSSNPQRLTFVNIDEYNKPIKFDVYISHNGIILSPSVVLKFGNNIETHFFKMSYSIKMNNRILYRDTINGNVGNYIDPNNINLVLSREHIIHLGEFEFPLGGVYTIEIAFNDKSFVKNMFSIGLEEYVRNN